MKKLEWKIIDRLALAEHLRTGDVSNAQAVEGASLYHCQHGLNQSLAIALDSGACLLIEPPIYINPARERRKRKTPPEAA